MWGPAPSLVLVTLRFVALPTSLNCTQRPQLTGKRDSSVLAHTYSNWNPLSVRYQPRLVVVNLGAANDKPPAGRPELQPTTPPVNLPRTPANPHAKLCNTDLQLHPPKMAGNTFAQFLVIGRTYLQTPGLLHTHACALGLMHPGRWLELAYTDDAQRHVSS